MKKHSGRRERKARKRQRRGATSTSQSGWLTFKLGRKKSLEFYSSNWKKFIGCVVDTEKIAKASAREPS